MTLLKLPPRDQEKIIKRLIKLIKRGNVVIFPTDTVYGLLADAANEKVVKKLFKIKKRLRKKPIPIFVKDIKTAKKLAFIDKEQEKILKKVWPGKVTVVLKRKPDCGLPKILFGGKKTIALRIPNYKLLNELLKKINKPLTGTSANISGLASSTKIKEILEQFEREDIKPDLILDAGNLLKSSSSTVIDLRKKKPKILRKGEFKLP